MNRAFILSSPSDFWMAEKCRDRLNKQGWTAFVMVDPKEWETVPDGALCANYSPGVKGMDGNAVALGILAGIITHSNYGDRVMKLDCDIWLDDEQVAWLAYGDAAKCYMLYREGKRPLAWGGLWAANRDHVLQAIEYPQDRCACPESVLNVRALHKTRGVVTHPSVSVTQWQPEMERKGICTLGIVRSIPRKPHGLALFDTQQ